MLDCHGLKHKHNMEEFVNLEQELEVLKSFVPAALREGALLVEFKPTDDSKFSSASVLTLNENEIIGSKPSEDIDEYGTWCFNSNRKYWVWLNYKEIDAIQPWPLIDPEVTISPQYQTPLLT